VGALNNGPFAYTSRPYELLTKNSIDLMDSLGSNVAIDYKDNTLMRVNPRVHEAINEEWLSDKSRQAFDGLKRQRLRVPLLRKGQDFAEETWEDALAMVASRIDKVDGSEIACGIGEFESVENIQAMKDFLNALNCFNYEFRRGQNLSLPNNFRSDFLFNSQIETIEDADLILLVGVNPRTETPVLNSRILKAITKKKAKVLSVGTPADLTYAYSHLGNSANVLADLASGQHPAAEELKAAKLPMIIVGYDALTRSDSHAILNSARAIAETYKVINPSNGWNGFNILHRSQGEINALELGLDFKPIATKPKVIFLLGCDNNISPEDIPADAFVVYIVQVYPCRVLTEIREHSTLMSSCLLPPTQSVRAPMVLID
jgi:NADH dehydrogenase (ubiquinone) Fe-S protein 1